MTTHVRCEVSNGIGHITLARVEKRNAITRDMMSAVIDSLATSSTDDDVAAVIVSGEDMFSAGWDRNEMLVTDPASWDRFVERIGFVTRVVPTGEALAEARLAPREIAAVPAATIG